MTADEEAQLKNYLQNIDPDDGTSPYAPEYYVHPGYGPITFWDKREVIVSNKDVTPDGLAGPATATLTLMYALTIEDAVVFVDPNTELDEKVIAGLFLIPTPAKFGKPFFKQADDLGGAANLGRKRQKESDLLDTKGTGNKRDKNPGGVIKDGSHIDTNGALKPNVKYKAGEYEYLYETDNMGRLKEFDAGDLKLTKRDSRLPHKPNTPGKEAGDHAGHLAADRFGGSPDLDNLVSQSSNVNLSKYKKLENQWATAIKEGKKVSVNVKINYEGT